MFSPTCHSPGTQRVEEAFTETYHQNNINKYWDYILLGITAKDLDSKKLTEDEIQDQYIKEAGLLNIDQNGDYSIKSEYQDYIIQINDLTHNKMPDETDSTDWTEYGLVPLEEKLATYEQRQSVMMKSGWGNESHASYESHYLPIYNTITEIKAQIDVINAELDKLKNEQSVYYAQMSTIINDLAMENNFTDIQLKELDNFIREDELTSDNYVVTSIMSDEERFEMLDDFLKHGEKELAKKATPQLTFTAEMLNLFSMEEFSSWYDDFNVGNYIHVSS